MRSFSREALVRRSRQPSARALIGTLIGSAPGFALPFAVASHFGIGRTTDAYVFALALAQFCVTLASGVLESNVLPVAQAAKAGGRSALSRFVRRTAWQAAAFGLLTFALVAAVGALLILRRGSWTGAERHEALLVLAILAGFVVCVAVNSVLAASLYALGDFLTPTLSQSLRSLLPLAALMLLGRGGAAVAALGTLIGVGELGRFAVLALRLRASSRALAAGRPKAARRLWRTAAPHGLSLLVVAVNPLIDRVIAAPLAPGSVTLLDLGEKVFYVPLMVLMSSVVLVSGARWAATAVESPRRLEEDLRSTLRRAFLLSAVLAAGTAVALVAAAQVAGPTFAGASTASIERVVVVFLVGLPAAVVASLGARFLTSTRQTRMLPAFAGFSVAANIGLDVAGAHIAGVDGIAAATVVMRTVSAAVYLIYCVSIARRMGGERVAEGGAGRAWRRASLSGRRMARGLASLPLVGAGATVLGVVAALEPSRVALAGAALGLVTFGLFLPRRWLPSVALCVYALVPTDYLNVPQWFGRFMSPAVVLLAIWEVRTLSDGRGARATRTWVVISAALALWLLFLTEKSSHHARSVLWTAVVIVAVAMAGIAARRSDTRTIDALLRTWTILAVVLGTAGVLEALTHVNPLAHHYVDGGQAIAQKWSVYRIETTLGHPLANALFFSTTAAVMAMLAVTRPTKWRVLAACASCAAVVSTASRSGAIAVSLGLAVGVVLLVGSSSTTVGKKVAIGVVLAVAVAAIAQAPILKERDSSIEGQSSSVYRGHVLGASLATARDDHYLGSGPGTSQSRVVAAGYSVTLEDSPLQLLFSLGAPGVALLSCLLALIAVTAARLRRWWAVAGLVAYLTCLTGFNAWDSNPQTLALLGILAAIAMPGTVASAWGASSSRVTAHGDAGDAEAHSRPSPRIDWRSGPSLRRSL